MTISIPLPSRDQFQAWRSAARLAISHDIAPEQIEWSGAHSDAQGLFADELLPKTPGHHEAQVPPDFLPLARTVIWHSAPERFAMLYKALWRLDHNDGAPLSPADPLGRRLALMAKSVARDIHKMHAFVRFRELASTTNRRSFGAWFEPEHHTLQPGAPFFVKRFADMDWLIATPELTAHYQNGKLTFKPPSARPDLPEDAAEALWATYFTNIFNPARVKLAAMRSEMPKKYWHNLPETRHIPAMLADAEARVERMRAAGASTPQPHAAAISTRYRAAMPLVIDRPQTMAEARQSAQQCRRCLLCEAATQTVWGEGNDTAHIMIVGEQPGDQEDLAGRPFVGPAGQLLRDIMAQAHMPPETVWLTNAVKHFKFTSRGNHRLHQSPNRSEIEHCRWWLTAELGFVQPRLTIALGASAAFALTNNKNPLKNRRGQIETGLHGGPVLISWHPSHILRTKDPADKQRLHAEILADLSAAVSLMNQRVAPERPDLPLATSA